MTAVEGSDVTDVDFTEIIDMLKQESRLHWLHVAAIGAATLVIMYNT